MLGHRAKSKWSQVLKPIFVQSIPRSDLTSWGTFCDLTFCNHCLQLPEFRCSFSNCFKSHFRKLGILVTLGFSASVESFFKANVNAWVRLIWYGWLQRQSYARPIEREKIEKIKNFCLLISPEELSGFWHIKVKSESVSCSVVSDSLWPHGL